MPILTVIDTSGIQNYIFGSNRLRENIGASEIVALATSDWVKDLLREKHWATNVDETNLRIERDSLDAELIYAGGGNTLIVFKDAAEARDFTKRYTRFLLAAAPGLSVVIAHSTAFTISDTDDCAIRDQLEKVMKSINEKKVNRKLSAPLLGMGVTAKCASTGGVASFDPVLAAENGTDEQKTLRDKYGYNYVSAETLAKLGYPKKATDRLEHELLGDNTRWNELKKGKLKLQIPYELDNLGRTEGEASYIAVVHTDGNRMGKRIESVGKDAQTSREWITKIRSFSHEINEANLNALRATLALLIDRIRERKDENESILVVDGGHGEEFALSRDKKRAWVYLPLRPLIFGGEDVAFVCDGRIALALTAFYLNKAEEQILPDKRGLYARAGVALVKSHHPFSRAYSIAENLARSARTRIDAIRPDGQVSALDWHLAMTGLAGDVEEIRRREYKPDHGELNMRPLSSHHEASSMQQWRSWESFRDISRVFLSEEWRERRNKVKALRDALRDGEKAVESFETLYGLEGQMPTIAAYPRIGQHGWEGDVCVWFDAIEMLDLFYPLEDIEKQTTAARPGLKETRAADAVEKG